MHSSRSIIAASLLLALTSTVSYAKGRPGTNPTEPADPDVVLPVRVACSATINLWAQDMTDPQVADTCAQLSAQETDFHQRMQTFGVPVADDYNDSLRVVVFDDYTQYDKYGYELFNINTNNGGIYIEGNPADVNNQASFYAHEADWLRPEFEIWNLRHEYIHYLDGRFVSYGGFNFYPGKMVWWSEGLAEYLSQGTDNATAVNLAINTRVSRRPTLSTIFSTSYRDGTDRVYRWSYLAIRFLFENHQAEVLAMTEHLKNNNFAGYEAALNDFSANYQSEFANWLNGLAPQKVTSRDSKREEMLQRHAERHGRNQ
ncbi:collagenase [Shewanella litorisediminis]|uniref:Collagenase n=1 Tax=Shewanella litorisediminis TaxID=1173586 RepID=A0ABX7G7H8_9GAMM|nr:collagenase [Shewanella litorisediminis]MCL2919803.1 collagenase [Shewanella litorisediminis]QRH03226.1 collagenase [Shewanella litorisediminis]